MKGYLSLHEFINGLEVIVHGDQEEKMKFLFKLFDLNSDGFIDFEEMNLLLKCCMEETPFVDLDQLMEEITTYLFTNSDKDDSGDICFEELNEALKNNDAIYRSLTFSTSLWIKPKFIKPKQNLQIVSHCIEAVKNKQNLLIFWLIYTAIHLACSITAIVLFIKESIWVICAHIFGNALNFNCSLILLLVLRKHSTWLRTKNACLPIDEFIDIHKILGWIILVESLLHTAAHIVNLVIVCEAKDLNLLTVLLTASENRGYPTGVYKLMNLYISNF